MARLISIVYQPENQPYEQGHGNDFMRVPLLTAELVADHGIKGDRKAGRSPTRQVNLLSAAWLAQKKEQGYQTDPGQFGEQLIVEGVTLETLQPGDRLQIGEEAVLEITKARTGCERLEAAQGASGLAGTHIGLLSRVVRGGVIRVNDQVNPADQPAGP